MKLKKIWINNFKNIHNLELDFSIRNGTTVLIGNNGSGKSNILEAISSIFYLLLYSDVKDFPGQFEITYEINASEINTDPKNVDCSVDSTYIDLPVLNRIGIYDLHKTLIDGYNTANNCP